MFFFKIKKILPSQPVFARPSNKATDERPSTTTQSRHFSYNVNRLQGEFLKSMQTT